MAKVYRYNYSEEKWSVEDLVKEFGEGKYEINIVIIQKEDDPFRGWDMIIKKDGKNILPGTIEINVEGNIDGEYPKVSVTGHDITVEMMEE